MCSSRRIRAAREYAAEHGVSHQMNWALARSAAADIPSLIEKFRSETIGPIGETQAKLAELFPRIRWVESTGYKFKGTTIKTIIGIGGGVVLSLSSADNQNVLFVSIESKKRPELEKVKKHLGLRVIDRHFGATGG